MFSKKLLNHHFNENLRRDIITIDFLASSSSSFKDHTLTEPLSTQVIIFFELIVSNPFITPFPTLNSPKFSIDKSFGVHL